ncbi:extracellular solute-binding protein [Oxalobacteraceae bacterium CAVE-383]|nr:extracellular solute-binding protein [Oxalobacteraceae bacterium CAVE-383]
MDILPFRRACLIAALLLLGSSAGVFGQTAGSSPSIEGIADYQGSDRAQRLLAGAKKEREFTLYTNIAATDLDKLKADFEKRYGVTMKVWRAAPEVILQRVMAEAKAKRFDFDAVHISTPEMEVLHREGLLQAVNSPHMKELVPVAIPAHREWAATFLSVWVQAYNTNQIRKEDLPETYADLLNPKWKGKLGIEAKNTEWFYTVAKEMGEEEGLKYFRKLVATNGISVRRGTSLLNNMVVSGEVPLALTVYNFMAEQSKQNGAPIDWFVIEPAIARGNAVGVSKKATHPYSAVLFYDYMITDAQKLLASMEHVPTNKSIPSRLSSFKLKLVDPASVLDESEKAERLYDEIVVRAAK